MIKNSEICSFDRQEAANMSEIYQNANLKAKKRILSS